MDVIPVIPSEPFDWAVRFPLGLAIVGLMAIWRFNTPSWSRTYTTAAKYWLTLAAYVLSQVLVYYLLSATLFVTRAWPLLSPIPIVFSIVATTCLLPMVPAFEYWRRWLHRLAGVPHEAVHLGQVLLEAEFSAPVDVETEVKSVLLRRGYDPDQEWFPVADPVQKLWLKASVVFHLLRSWESRRRQAEFIRRSRNEFDILRQRFDLLSMKVSRTFGNIERLGTIMCRASPTTTGAPATAHAASESGMHDPDVKEMLKRTVGDMLDSLREDIAFFLGNTCVLLARGVLSTELTENGRIKRLRELGFRVEAEAMRPLSVFLYSFVVVLTAMVVSFAAIRTGSGEQNIYRLALRIVMIAAIQVTALGVAIVPKMLWGFANPGLSGRVPIRVFLATGAVAVVLSAIVGFVFRILIWGSVQLALKEFSATYPWLIMAFSTAVLTAFLIQDHRWASSQSRSQQQCKDAAVMGIGLCVSIYLVQLCFWMIGTLRFLLEGEGTAVAAHWGNPASELMMGLIVLVMGSFIGYAVPASFREARPLRVAQLPSPPARLSASTASLEPSLAAEVGAGKR